jgi:D-xylose transport system permease protein
LVAIYAVNRILGWRGRHQRGVSKTPFSIVIIQIVIVALIVFAVTYVANQDRVIIFVVVLLLVLLVGFTFLAERTRFGRYVYAICGSAEAARRAGINVDRIKIDVLMISSIMAGMGGIVLASRLRSVDTAAGGGNLMLNSIAATVRNRGSPEGLFEQ